jgi:GDP-4-dehydro-6-deoxy-D-mannose reductase
MRLVTDPTRRRPIDTPVLRGSADRLRAATAWAPAIPIEETLADLLDHERARRRVALPHLETG